MTRIIPKTIGQPEAEDDDGGDRRQRLH